MEIVLQNHLCTMRNCKKT